MRSRFLIIAVIVCILQLTLRAQDELKSTEAGLRLKIGALAHDSMLGREAGTKAEMKAARFIASEFSSMGVKPALTSGSYLQPFYFGGINYVEAKLVFDSVEYTGGVDVGAIAASADGMVSGTVADVNHGLLLEKLNINDFTRENIAGKIALINQYLPKQLTRNCEGRSLSVFSRIQNAFDYGAAGVIVYNSAPYAKAEDLFHPDSVKIRFDKPVLYVTNAVAEKIRKKPGGKAEITVKIDRKREVAYNVAGYVDNGSRSVVVIGAHYDHVGAQNPKDSSTIFNGSDDNASGTAGMLELARWIASDTTLKYNYLFLAFSAEEKGLLGSYHWCYSDEFNLYKPLWMLNLDMIGRMGWNGRNYLAVNGTASSKDWKKILSESRPSAFRLVKIKGAPPLSDHHPFYLRKVPVLYFNTGLHHDYHKPVDDSDRINYKGEAMIIEYLKKVISATESRPEIRFRKITRWQALRAYASMLVFRK